MPKLWIVKLVLSLLAIILVSKDGEISIPGEDKVFSSED